MKPSQSHISYVNAHLELSSGLLTQADGQDVATRYCSHKLMSNHNTCRKTQPPFLKILKIPLLIILSDEMLIVHIID
ncbi:Hypoxia-inducible factor 1-alpha [Gossypium australe]|uniref:Hypoxia-inducible factor 1-alpha n=1 Tax=Gossypium australe TaxID=47621 RepID=A0A5B6WP22_9ROSI|nr:Hypoxia-inducible factor 1-alpha [Gossypium australe]